MYMVILPAIDLHEGQCVRLHQGEFSTAEKVAEDALETAKGFEEKGARWLHMVDLDGAKNGKPMNRETIFRVIGNTGLRVEIGGGIRDMKTVEEYLEGGVSRVILGSAALQNPDFVKEAVAKYGKRIAVGIDARGGKVAAAGWLETSDVDYLEMAKRMEDIGVRYLIVTDISKDGTLNGPNLDMLDKINNAVSCNIIASGGVSNLKDIFDLHDLNLYGAICGKSLYAGSLDLKAALLAAHRVSGNHTHPEEAMDDFIEQYFRKGDLIPAIVQEAATGEVLMLAYMNRESLKRTFSTGYTWFYSRSRQTLWNKGATSGHVQKVVSISADCDDDTLLVKVIQTGNACHTGSHSCFYKTIWKE